MSPPLSVSPEAAFIAASAASQIVTADLDAHSETWYDQVGVEPSGETALVSNGALQLANNFVDQLLFNVLATAKSTALPALRSAVVDVLKPKLAKDVINSADEELREYLGGGEIEELARSAPLEASKDWDLELVWKRTRLRCMVYSSLGDMEEEDEDYYTEQEHLNGEAGDALTDLVSPAVAIFLTSILEFMGEQILIVAGQAAFNRLRAKYEIELKDGSRLPGDLCDRVVVGELDMERVALDRTFGRLWRAWKKRIRSPLEPNFSRPFSRSSAIGSVVLHQRRESSATELQTVPAAQELDTTAKDQTSQSDMIQVEVQKVIKSDSDSLDPSMLPLPDSDVEATYSDEEELDDETLPPRPKSWFGPSHHLDVENAFTSPVLVKRTPSLPSRKKRWSSSIPPIAEHAEVAQVMDTPDVEAGFEAASNAEARLSGSDEKVTTDAVVLGAATIADLPAATTSVSPQTEVVEDDRDDRDDTTDYEVDSEIEEFAEEPEILTSSRISVGGGSSSATSESGRPSSIVLTRSSSVRSVRVIEVQSPRSRASSVETDPLSPSARSFSISRERSISRTPPIVEENDPHAAPFGTAMKSTPGIVLSPDEVVRDAGTMLAPPPRNRSPPKPTSSPVPSHTPAAIKVTIIDNTASVPREERHDSVKRPLSGLRNAPMPTLPERNANRLVYGQSTSAQRSSPESPKLPRSIQSEPPSGSRLKTKRTSEESSSNRPADVARHFEELIQSNETLQYTLTPENMRDIDVSSPLRLVELELTSRQSPSTQSNSSPKAGHRTGKNEDAQSERSRSSSLKRSLSVSKSTGLGSHPPPDMPVNDKYSNATSKSLPPVSLRNRTGPVPKARDARVARESMQDFADFIRSTGPRGETTMRANRPVTGTSNITRSVTGPPSLSKSSSMEARRGPKLQARDAIVNTSNESSELIDFIRRGPPSANGNSPRIPRTVAPFRNTQDSDYMMSAVGGKAVDAIIPEFRTSQSTNITEASAPSSMNSQSALLNKSNRRQHSFGNSFDEDEIMPKRTRIRARDPYAIDSSDEDDEGYDVTPQPQPQPQPKQEESLIDFLNNYPPPAEPSTQPIVSPKKKSSTPNLIARLRSGSSAGLYGSGYGRKGSGISEHRGLNSRGGPKVTHTPIVVPTVTDRYNSSITSPAAPRAASYGRVPMKRFEPRDASTSSSHTADLANFLRDSQPPPSMTALPSPPEDRTSSGFSRIFERRKKSTAY
jgi:hypothetical protein